MRTIVGFCAIAALGLTGCNGNSNDFVAGPVDPTPTEDPFGNPIGSPISGLAAFIAAPGIDPVLEPGGPVAAHNVVIVTFNVDGSFTVTTPGGVDLVFSGDGTVQPDPVLGDIFQFTNADGDVLEVVHGFDAAENRIFDIARVNEAGSPAGFETYGVIGNETETANLPTGTATYTGGFLASIFNAGTAITDEFKGTTTVTADFANAIVTSLMAGSYDVAGVIFDGTMDSTATLVGSQYTGTFNANVAVPNVDLGLPFDSLLITGDAGQLAGAFYGLTGEATAGAFAGRDDAFSDPLTPQPLEIVGGFAADIVPPTP